MDYLDRAKLLGQDVDLLKKGQIIKSTYQVRSIEEFKAIFAAELSLVQRHALSQGLSGVRWRPEQPAMRRLMDWVFGEGDLSSADGVFAKQLFPLEITVVSGQNITYKTNESFGPNGAPVVVNADVLTFDGGSISLLNTVMTLNAATLVITSNQGTMPYHIGILGAPGSAGAPGTAGPAGSAGAPGTNASAPTPGICTGASDGGPGGPGGPGQSGGTGGAGALGKPSQVANISITAFPNPDKASLVIYTQSGAGGPGGPGGTGGAGGAGGVGGNGCNSGAEGTDGGNGGTGGNGGNGGMGGPGGNGANGNPIQLSFPGVNGGQPNPFLVVQSSTALPGAGGPGGLPGQKGSGGGGGAGGHHKSDGSPGASGQDGSPGSPGQVGATSGAAGQVNYNWTTLIG